MEYNFREIEKKWQEYWKKNDTYKTHLQPGRPKYYVLDMFPYPSGAGLHVGHPLGYIASDIVSRYKRMQGFNVLHPMGFDAFGLPAEQYAIQTGKHPAETTRENIKKYKSQLDKIGFSFDWSRQVKTSDPSYYKWTQWIFLQLFESWYDSKEKKARAVKDLEEIFLKHGNEDLKAPCNFGTPVFGAGEWKNFSDDEKQKILLNYRLAYLREAEVNWCPALGTVLANDEVKEGVSERGGYPVVKKKMMQWFLRITAYQERLLEKLDSLDWSDAMKEMQRNWIGKSEGAVIRFEVMNSSEEIKVFTTRPDTVFGSSFMVLSPENSLVEKITAEDQKQEVQKYREYAASRSERERLTEVGKVTGAFTGAYCKNPFSGEKLPVWIADYVLNSYGTGAIMAVPAHDSRDHAFAREFGLAVREVVEGGNPDKEAFEAKSGKLINSGFLNDLEVNEAISKVIEKIEKDGLGEKKVNFRLRDAAFSRQRYWGEPFPIYFKNGVPYPLSEEKLPLELPPLNTFQPTEEGDPPLARAEGWESEDGFPLETDTMPGYAGSSWYFFRYMDPENENRFVSEEAEKYWGNVDFYMGGSEHAVGHLLYARFWSHFLYDRGWVSRKEPFQKLVNQGMIQGMSQKIFKVVKNRGQKISDPLLKEALNKAGKEPVFVSSVLARDFKSCTISLNVDISLVEKEVLDMDGYCNWRPENKDAVFLTPGGFWQKGNFFEIGKGEKEFMTKPEVEKMSKSKFNVVNPDDVVESYGADTFRLYEMFLGPIEQHKPWDTQGIDGCYRFLNKFHRLFLNNKEEFEVDESEPSEDELKVLHKAIKKVKEDIERNAFNTAVSAMMVAVNDLTSLNSSNRKILEKMVLILSSFAPHLSEELWEKLGHPGSVTKERFPDYDPEIVKEDVHEYPVAINGKTRAKIELSVDMDNKEVEKRVLLLDPIAKRLNGSTPKKIIVVPGKIINIVV